MLILAIATTGCRNEDYIEGQIFDETYDNDSEPYDESTVDADSFPDWSEATHSNAVDPNYDIVFAQGKVLRMDITLSSSSWSSMKSDLSSNLSKVNNSNYDYTPIWQPCTVRFNATDWYNVGIRFKGNSSLSSAYSSGVMKLSFKLDFDQYEDDYPALTNQRFYGFKQLNLGNNYKDKSLMREKVGADLFRSFGLAAAQTAFCQLYIDTGSGSQYFGLYTLVEEVDDTVIDSQFSSGSGNLYKPDGDAAQFNYGSYDTSELYLKTNTASADYSDVRALYDAINDSSRRVDSVAWQEELERVFDVDIFLRWLAANAVIQNWDTYGRMSHNYYLYNNPSSSLLTWIPWDNNEAFQSSSSNSSAGMSSSSMSAIEVSEMGSVSSSWPLISYLYDVDEYVERYKVYLKKFVDEVFVTSDMQALYEEYYNLLKSSAEAEEYGYTFFSRNSASSEFASAVSTLKAHAESRTTTVNKFTN
ncbi:MAG: CotH kinase family protein [Rikenellaceae bacterium]